MKINILSETALQVVFGDQIALDTHQSVLQFVRYWSENPFPGLISVSPAYADALVIFDAASLALPFVPAKGPLGKAAAVADWIKAKMPFEASQIERTNAPSKVLPVRYDGPDLKSVTELTGLDVASVVRLHSSIEYQVFMIGFLPGFPYLGILPEPLCLPRKATPRLRVPAGSVAIAGKQTGIYPQASPGGWHLIGKVDVPLFDSKREPPALLQAGDRIKFDPI